MTIVRFPLERRPPAGPDLLVTKRQLAERWQVSQRWIELRVRDDGLPVVKDRRSRFVRFPLGACERWRAERMSA